MVDLTTFASDSAVTDDYPISAVAKNEWLSFAKYTVEARAIPNMIDGMKPVQRFYLYSSILNSKRDYKKVSAVSGIISDYGYNHGETSAAGAGQLMAANWNNNICLIEGRGSFGTRLVQEAGAARYVYTRLHENFDRYVTDLALSPKHEDPEHEPPAFYLPTIPLVLANGTKGIATGFATNILPRDPADLLRKCEEYITKDKVSRQPKIKFPEFSGDVKADPESPNKWIAYGTYEKTSKTMMTITEVPYGFDREGYVKVLDKLEEEGDIVGYDDLCDKNGFRFEVKLKQVTSAKWNDTKIVSKFKLSKSFVENLTVIDFDGRLREYDDARELIKDFCDYRLGILQKRIALRQEEARELGGWLNVKMQFIEAVLDDKIIFKNKKKAAVAKQILDVTDATKDQVDRLLRINIMSLTDEMVKELKKEIGQAQKDYKFWSRETPQNQFISDLDELRNQK